MFQSFSTRAYVLLCFYLAIAASLPFWIKTTTIERLSLPREDVEEWESQLPCPIRFQHVLALVLPENVTEGHEEIASEVARALRAASDGVWALENADTHQEPSSHEQADPSLRQSSVTPREHAACIDWDVRPNTRRAPNDGICEYDKERSAPLTVFRRLRGGLRP